MAKHGDIWVSPCGAMELRCGRWQDALSGVVCESLVMDPPYSDTTHDGQCADQKDGADRRALSYEALSPEDVSELTHRWAQRCGWFVALSDDVLCRHYRAALNSAGKTTFQPLPCVIRGMTVRLSGDGPSSWAIYANVARSKKLSKWGTLPGAYSGTPDRGGHIGGKPMWLMRAIVSDYSRPGDLVCDPFAGGGTTLLAAAIEGRRAIGAEESPETYARAVRRLSAGYTPVIRLPVGPRQKQEPLL